MIVYGLYGFTHGWGRVLTVMSPEGAAAVTRHVVAGDDILVSSGDGKLSQYFEKREHALARLVESYRIIVLSKQEWDAKKAELGERIW
jgi:hypothetical protein